MSNSPHSLADSKCTSHSVKIIWSFQAPAGQVREKCVAEPSQIHQGSIEGHGKATNKWLLPFNTVVNNKCLWLFSSRAGFSNPNQTFRKMFTQISFCPHKPAQTCYPFRRFFYPFVTSPKNIGFFPYQKQGSLSYPKPPNLPYICIV